MQLEIDTATELVESRGEHNRIDVGAYTEAMQQLKTTLGAAVGSGLAAGSPFALAVEKLISHLKVIP